MTIQDLLNESMAPGTLYHYTNAINLIPILKSGKIKTSDKFGGVSLVRPSMIHQDMKMLSRNIGKVRFIIDRSKITSGKIKGLKIEKIAEYPTKYINYFKNKGKDIKQEVTKYKKYGWKGYDGSDKELTMIKNYLASLKHREGEEKSNVDIPIKYTKIELLPGFNEEVERNLSRIYSKKKLRELIQDNENFFIKNKEFREITHESE